VIDVSLTTITTFLVLWFALAAFLLLNLVVAAIVNNYQQAMDESKQEEKKEKLCTKCVNFSTSVCKKSSNFAT